MTKTSKKLAVVLFLMALTLMSACSHLKEGNESATQPKAENGNCSKTDDSTVAANVKTEFSKKLRNKVPEAIKLDTKAGVVTLTGKINFDGTKKYAAEIAKGVKCVKDVVNNIEVTPAPSCSSGDKWCCCEDGACVCMHVNKCPICEPKVAKK
jgi:osmotically-inducible protein OsmY